MLAQTPKSKSQANAAAAALPSRAAQKKEQGENHTLLTFDVVEELDDLLQVAEGQPGEARSSLSLLHHLLDVCLDVREHLLGVLGAVDDPARDGVLPAVDLAADAEHADEVPASVSAVDAHHDVAEDDLVALEPVAAAVVELDEPDAVGGDWVVERGLVQRQRNVVCADVEIEAVDGSDQS